MVPGAGDPRLGDEPAAAARRTPVIDILADAGLLDASQIGSPGASGGVDPHHAAPTAVAPGEAFALGPYDVLERLGAGAMGTVYRARHRALGRLVALKLLGPQVALDATGLERFQREARILARLEHPGIVQVLDVGAAEGRHYIAMELIEGEDLSRRLARGPFELVEAVTLMAAICRAVGHVHRQGYIHRDLKPANVLLDSRGGPHVSDFGLARTLGSGATLTGTHQVVGTPQYMAPEHFRAGERRDLGPSVDVFSLGVLFYEILTRQLPFHGATPLALFRCILEVDPVSPRSLRPALAPEVEAVCLMALRKDPGQRYAQADELADDLERLLRHDPVRARPEAWHRRWARALRRHRLRTALALIVLCALASVGVYAAWSEERARRQAELERAARAGEVVREAEAALVRHDLVGAYALYARGLRLDPGRPGAAEGFKRVALLLLERAQGLNALDEATFIVEELARARPDDAQVVERRSALQAAVAAVSGQIRAAISDLQAEAARRDASGAALPLSESRRHHHFARLLSLRHPSLTEALLALLELQPEPQHLAVRRIAAQVLVYHADAGERAALLERWADEPDAEVGLLLLEAAARGGR